MKMHIALRPLALALLGAGARVVWKPNCRWPSSDQRGDISIWVEIWSSGSSWSLVSVPTMPVLVPSAGPWAREMLGKNRASPHDTTWRPRRTLARRPSPRSKVLNT